MDPGHRERRDDHGEAAQQEDRTSDREKPARNDEAMFVEQDDEEPDGEQRHPGDLGHVESPGDVGHVVEDYVGEGRVLVHVWDPVVHDSHSDGGEPGDEQAVDEGECELPALWGRGRGQVGLGGGQPGFAVGATDRV